MANELKFGNKVIFLGGNPLTLPIAASDPGSASNGDMYYNSALDVVRIYQAGAWITMSTGTVSLTGQTLQENEIIVGNVSNLSAAVDTSAAGDILADSSGGLTIKSGVIVNADVNASAAIDLTKLAATTINRALVSDGSGFISPATTTATEIGYVNGVTSSIQTQLNGKAAAADVADLVTLSGVAVNSTSLGTFTGAIIPDSSTIKAALQSLETSIESLPNPITYEGTWAASTNTPTLADGVGDQGDLYQVTDAGTVDFGSGNITFAAGDKVVYNGATWEKWDMTDAVTSVNGQSGVVVLDTDDIAEGTALYFTDERAQDAVGGILANSSKVSLTYLDGTPSITADIVAGSLVNADINASAAIALTKLAAVTANRALASDASGFIVASAVTDTELGYVSGVTSAIQTQLNAKASTALSNLASVAINTSLISDTDNTDDLGSDAIEWKDIWAYSLKHNSAGTPTLSIATTGNNGSINLNANGTGALDIQATKMRRSESGASSNYMEEQYYDALSLTNNISSPTAISSLTFAFASFNGVVVDYMIKETTSNKVRIGTLRVSTDGSNVSASDMFSETAVLGSALGLSLDAAINGANVEIRYNNTHATNTATVRCLVRRIRA